MTKLHEHANIISTKKIHFPQHINKYSAEAHTVDS